MANLRNRVSSLPHILTSERVLFSILTVLVLTVFVNAQDTVSRTNTSGTVTGTDVATVQTADGAAEGDVIILSGTATHNSGIDQTLETFTIRSATAGVKQTINAYQGRLYNINNGVHTYTINLQDLDYQGNASAVSEAIGLFIHTSPDLTLNINTNNVSFTGFKNAQHDGGVFGLDNAGNLNITATNGLVFDSNRANASSRNGGAIRMTNGALTINADTLTFKDNYAQKHGGAIHSGSSVSITGNTILFSGSTAKDNDGGAIHSGSLTINGIDENSTTTFQSNTAKGIGGAISTGALNLSTGSFYFDSNTLTTFQTAGRAGAINANSITITNVNTLSFTNNTSASKAGAMYSTGDISISAKSVKFENNETTAGRSGNTNYGKGGGIFADGGNVTIDANTISFTGNKAKQYGAAIRVESSKALNITGTTITFENNVVSDNDGGAISGSNLTITGKSADAVTTFKNNSAKYIGGAIGASSMTFKTGNFYFQNNKATTYHDNATGGGISTGGAIKFSDANIISFTNNTGTRLGGAVYAGSLEMSAKSITFTGNKASASGYTNGQGGAIYCTGSVTFSGENVVAEFSGNSATDTNAGNDLYLSGTGGLTFQDNGTYSFDGGIYMNNTNKPATVINQAQVTIAGRANDSTNKYQFFNVNISNGGSLTANLDYIDSLTGTFNVGTADSAGTLELNVGSDASILLDSLKIYSTDKGEVKKTGEGTLRLYTALEGLVDAESFVVSSGRLDMQKYFKGAMIVGEKLGPENYSTAIFSPGNSVGTLTIDDSDLAEGEYAFTLNPGSTLLIEKDETGLDTLIASSFNIASDSIIQLSIDSLQPGASYPFIVNTSPDGFTGDMANVDFWSGLLTPESDYYWNLSLIGNTLYASVDANAVPEPSTWALLALGVCGLLYLRKRK
ncbi:MAG: PEP-CTERM sorting domain-containing protein [Thermoguttaceae bacterium]|nr:PEP-CTERM sorting domain-containing protein [Thermoguttaceae bacterium]